MRFLNYIILLIVVSIAGLLYACNQKPEPAFSDHPAEVSIETPDEVQRGLVEIDFTIFDRDGNPSRINVLFSQNNGQTWQMATLGAGGNSATNLETSEEGVDHDILWDSVADMVGLYGAENDVQIKIIPFSFSLGVSDKTASFSVRNDPNDPPAVDIITPAGLQGGNVSLGYTLYDLESDECSITVEFITGNMTAWQTATGGTGGDGTSDLDSDSNGVDHSFVWNSVEDNVAITGADEYVRLRVIPKDKVSTGDDDVTSFFRVNNAADQANVTITIGPGGGYDYINLSEAEANVAQDHLSGDKDIVSQGITVKYLLYGSWSESVSISGWTTDSAHRLLLSAGAGRPVIYDDSSGVLNYTLGISCNNVKVSGIHLIANTSTQSENYAFYFDMAENVTVVDCILEARDGLDEFPNYASNLAGSFIRIDNCLITAPDAGGIYDITEGDFSDIEIKNCIFRDISKRALVNSYKSNFRVHGNRFEDGVRKEHAIFFRHFSNVWFYNNMVNVSNITKYGIYFRGAQSKNGASYIINNTVYGSSGSSYAGLYLEDVNNGTLTVANNIIYFTEEGTGFYWNDLSNSGAVTSDRNLVYHSDPGSFFGYDSSYFQSASEWHLATGQDNSSIEDDPDFLSYDQLSALWLHISGSSPCRQAGTNFSHLFTEDIDHGPRPASGAWCIGADETPP